MEEIKRKKRISFRKLKTCSCTKIEQRNVEEKQQTHFEFKNRFVFTQSAVFLDPFSHRELDFLIDSNSNSVCLGHFFCAKEPLMYASSIQTVYFLPIVF